MVGNVHEQDLRSADLQNAHEAVGARRFLHHRPKDRSNRSVAAERGADDGADERAVTRLEGPQSRVGLEGGIKRRVFFKHGREEICGSLSGGRGRGLPPAGAGCCDEGIWRSRGEQ